MSPATRDRADTLAAIDLGELLEQLTGIEGRAGSWPCPEVTHAQTGLTPPVSLSADPQGYEYGHCHGCGWTGTAVDALMAARGIGAAEAFAELRDGVTVTAPPGHRPARKPERAFIAPELEQLDQWERGLHARPDLLLKYLAQKGWESGALAVLDVGWDGQRLTLPVRDRSGALVDVLRLLPGGKPKVLSMGGTRELWPSPEVLTAYDVRTAEGRRRLIDVVDVYILEGEADAISAQSAGLYGIAVPGANSWRPEWADRFDGMSVRILTDHDEAGRKLADAVGSDLAARGKCRDLRRISWPDLIGREPEPGYDLTDYLLEQRAGTERRAVA